MMWRRRRWKLPEPDTGEREQAKRAVKDAVHRLEAAIADDAPVDEVTAKLRELRRRNHFGPMITEALRGSR